MSVSPLSPVEARRTECTLIRDAQSPLEASVVSLIGELRATVACRDGDAFWESLGRVPDVFDSPLAALRFHLRAYRPRQPSQTATTAQ